MVLDATNVDVAITGAVYYAPTATTAPTTASSVLDAGFRDVGYISEDGVTETRDRTTQNIVAWQRADVVRVVTTEASVSFQFAMIETNANSVELYYGVPVDPLDGSIDVSPGASGGRRSMVVDYADGAHLIRAYLPLAELLETGDQPLVSGAAVPFDVTITGYPGPEGWTMRKWYSDLIAP